MRYFFLTYSLQPNGSYTESTGISKNLKLRDCQTCSVILDFKEQKVIKCSVNHVTVEKNWNRIVGYYRQFYADVFQQLESLYE